MKATIILDWENYQGPPSGERPGRDESILYRGEDGEDTLTQVHSRVRAAVADAVRGMDRGDTLRVKIDVLPRKGGKVE
jgi:hypothetical protein